MVREIHEDATVATAEPEDLGRDLTPDEVVMQSDPRREKVKRPRNRRHGRKR